MKDCLTPDQWAAHNLQLADQAAAAKQALQDAAAAEQAAAEELCRQQEAAAAAAARQEQLTKVRMWSRIKGMKLSIYATSGRQGGEHIRQQYLDGLTEGRQRGEHRTA